MTIEDTLLQRFGPLLSIAQLATVLDRSPDGLRISLRATNEWAQGINKARLKIGRRVYFRTSQIAQLIDEQFSMQGHEG
ncbi:plasmid-related protein [Burkholderia ubonensis]|nr:plasmid-related protein [Burkholderia ubonensis]